MFAYEFCKIFKNTFYKTSGNAWKVSVFRVILVRIFHIQTECGEIGVSLRFLSIFSPNAGPEKLRIRTLFTQCGRLLLDSLRKCSTRLRTGNLQLFLSQLFICNFLFQCHSDPSLSIPIFY